MWYIQSRIDPGFAIEQISRHSVSNGGLCFFTADPGRPLNNRLPAEKAVMVG
jgi:hypothetical protein